MNEKLIEFIANNESLVKWSTILTAILLVSIYQAYRNSKKNKSHVVKLLSDVKKELIELNK